MLSDSLTAFIEVLATWDGFEGILPKVKSLVDNIRVIGQKTATENKLGCGYNVLNHGDFHIGNIIRESTRDGRIGSFCFVSSN
jgi:hypothetical protein